MPPVSLDWEKTSEEKIDRKAIRANRITFFMRSSFCDEAIIRDLSPLPFDFSFERHRFTPPKR
jgi:hypothetical protein